MSVNTMIKNAAALKITDMCGQMYEPELNICLTEEERLIIADSIEAAEPKSKGAGGYYLYKLVMIDGDGNAVGELAVDTFGTVESSENGSFKRTGRLGDILDRIEEKYGLDTALLARRPGKNYFSMLDRADSGICEEITENNFIQGAEYDLSKDDLAVLAGVAGDVSFSGSADKEAEKKYIIHLYSEDGAELYELFLDEGKRVYTDEGYAIKDSEFTDHIKAIINFS